MEKLRAVLSPQQKEKLQEVKEETKENVRDRMAYRIATLKDLNLTDVQKSEIAAIRKAYRPRVQEADSKLRATVREEVEAILAVLKGS
jgi:Spy/CpxP family protein refolding chaperone